MCSINTVHQSNPAHHLILYIPWAKNVLNIFRKWKKSKENNISWHMKFIKIQISVSISKVSWNTATLIYLQIACSCVFVTMEDLSNCIENMVHKASYLELYRNTFLTPVISHLVKRIWGRGYLPGAIVSLSKSITNCKKKNALYNGKIWQSPPSHISKT